MEAHVHLPDHLAQHAAQEAERLRISLDDLIVVAIHDFTEQPSERRARLLAEVAAYVERHFSPENFPSNVTLRVFHHIRGDERLRMLLADLDAQIPAPLGSTGSKSKIDFTYYNESRRGTGRFALRLRVRATIVRVPRRNGPGASLLPFKVRSVAQPG